MKIYLRVLGLFLLCTFLSCNNEEISSEETSQEDYFVVKEYSIPDNQADRASTFDYCFTVDLIAGQNMNIGTVAVFRTDTDLILTYNTFGDWTIGTTHVSIGDCNEEWVPLTGSGNPKIGKFGHTEPHSVEINRVEYYISLDVLPDYTDMFCFAAHAEVVGPNGEETAWAGGDDSGGWIGGRAASNSSQYGYTVREFDGRSWATYIEAYQWACGF